MRSSRDHSGDRPVAFYIHSLRSGRGAEGVVTNLAQALAARGHDVDLLLEDIGGAHNLNLPTRLKLIDLRRADDGTIAGHWWRMACLARNLLRPVRKDPVGSEPFLKALIRFLYKRKPPLYALSCYLKARRPAAIVSFLNYPNITLLLAAQAGAGDSKVMVNVRNHVSASVMNAKSRRMREIPVLMRNLFCYAERVIAPARDIGRDISKLTDTPMDRISILYNPVYRDEIISAAKALPGHPWLDSPADEPVILAVGKLMPQKDFATLLSAFSVYCAARPAKLIVLGEGDGRSDLLTMARELAIEDNVDFPGHVENPYAYYSRASLFVLSSAWEGLPNVLLEAMALGCPVVSTACPGGAAEILDDGRFGRLVPVGDPEALAEAMQQTLSQSLPKETLIARARDFSLEAIVDDYEHVLLGGANSITPDSNF